MKFSVIVPTVWKVNDYMQKLIASLDNVTVIDEILIINNKAENTPEWIHSFNKVQVITPKKGLYFNPSLNLGVDRARNELCCVINDDGLIDCDIFSFILNNMPDKLGAIFMDPFSINGKLVTQELHPFNSKNFPKEKKLIRYNNIVEHGPGMFFCFFKCDFVYIPEEIQHLYGDIFTYRSLKHHKLNNFLIQGFEMNLENKGSSSYKGSDSAVIYKTARADIDIAPNIIYNKKHFNKIDKKYTWCFMGQIHNQGERAKMIKSLKSIKGSYFCSTNTSWQSSDSIDTARYKRIMQQSIFVPCPRGNNSPDTFRLYEAIESGSIPIVERDEYWNHLFGVDHPLIQVSDWDKSIKDIEMLSNNPDWLKNYSNRLSSWWKEYKNKLSTTINSINKESNNNTISLIDVPTDKNLKTKQKQLLHLKNKWKDFIDDEKLGKYRNLYEWVGFISSTIKTTPPPKEKFSTYNPGKKIAIVSLYTPEISDFATCSEKSIREYCELQGYTFYIYREKLDADASANWSKAKCLLNHIEDHEHIIWMDSDTLIFNPQKRFEEIISKLSSTKKIAACQDIGSNNTKMSKGSMLNSGVLIFCNHPYSINILKKWLNFDGDKSSLYASGGDQEILCEILKKSDGFGYNRKIFPMNEFNTEPRLVDKDTFIIHFMAYPDELKKIFMNYFVS